MFILMSLLLIYVLKISVHVNRMCPNPTRANLYCISWALVRNLSRVQYLAQNYCIGINVKNIEYCIRLICTVESLKQGYICNKDQYRYHETVAQGMSGQLFDKISSHWMSFNGIFHNTVGNERKIDICHISWDPNQWKSIALPL